MPLLTDDTRQYLLDLQSVFRFIERVSHDIAAKGPITDRDEFARITTPPSGGSHTTINTVAFKLKDKQYYFDFLAHPVPLAMGSSVNRFGYYKIRFKYYVPSTSDEAVHESFQYDSRSKSATIEEFFSKVFKHLIAAGALHDEELLKCSVCNGTSLDMYNTIEDPRCDLHKSKLHVSFTGATIYLAKEVL